MEGDEGAQNNGGIVCSFCQREKAFSFEYDKDWINSGHQRLLDPDIQFFSGTQFPNNKESFGIFLDSMPDIWGRTLMKRRAAQRAKERNERVSTLYDIDYLLGVFDESRMGALCFKTELDGSFLDNDSGMSTPPWSSIRELQYAAHNFENGFLATALGHLPEA